MNAVEIEVGCMETIPFRRLVTCLNKFKSLLPAPVEICASAAYLRLCCDLAFDANISNRPGFIRELSLNLHFDLLERIELSTFAFGKKEWRETYFESELLVEHEKEIYHAGWFIAGGINKHTAGRFQNKHHIGGHVTSFRKKKKAIDKTAQAIAIELAPEGFYRDSRGNPLSSDQVKEAVSLIQQIDTIMRRDSRLPDVSNFSPGLVLTAFQQSAKWKNKMVNYKSKPTSALLLICQYLIEARNEHGFPETTEQILQQFDKYSQVMLDRYSERQKSQGRSGQVFLDVK